MIAGGLLIVPLVAFLALGGSDDEKKPPTAKVRQTNQPATSPPTAPQGADRKPAAAEQERPVLFQPKEIDPSELPSSDDSNTSVPPEYTGDRLFEAPKPELIDKAHTHSKSGRPMNAHKLKLLYAYGQENPDDPRPQLIFAFDDMNRDWHSAAVSHYRAAYDADPRAADHPRMLPDLIQLAMKPSQHPKALEALTDIYGDRARTDVEAALADAKSRGAGAEIVFLQKVLDAL